MRQEEFTWAYLRPVSLMEIIAGAPGVFHYEIAEFDGRLPCA